MKTISQDDNNLVMFPASKNFRVSLKEVHNSDPLQDLLNEYSGLAEEDLPSYLDERFEEEYFEEETASADAFDSLEAFMNRHQSKDNLTPDDKLIMAINERMEAIKEARARIKFYLDEMDMFLPAKRK